MSAGAASDATPRARRAWIAATLALLTIAAFALRTTGARCLVPQMVEVHERVYATQVELLRERAPHPELDRNFDYYPLLVARLALATQPAPIATPTTVAEHLDVCGADIVHLRRLVALLAAAAVPATYFLARRFMSSAASFLAAGLVAASPLSIAFGQQARPHAVIVGAVVAAVLGALLVRRKPCVSSYVVAGLALGLALAILQNGLAAVPALLVAHFLRRGGCGWRTHLSLVLALTIAAGAFALFSPRTSAAIGGGSSAEIAVEGEVADLSGHNVFLEMFDGKGFPILAHALTDYEPWLLATALVGLIAWIARHSRARTLFRLSMHEDLAVVLAWCVPYALVIGIYEVTYERFLLPILPCLACAAAFGLATLGSRIAGALPSLRGAALLPGALVLLVQGYGAVRLARACGATDTTVQTARWVAEHCPPGSARIAIFNTVDLPLLRTRAALDEAPRMLVDVTRRWLGYQGRLDGAVLADQRHELVAVPRKTKEETRLFQTDLPACVTSWHADYVIIEVYTRERRAVIADLRAELQRRGTRVARFSPFDDPKDDEVFMYAHLGSPGYGWWTRHLWHAVAFGPVIEIYELR